MAKNEQDEMLISSAGQLEVSFRTNDPWDLVLGTAFCNIGNICSRMGMLSDALAVYERDLQITERSLNTDDLRVIGSKYNSGLTLCKLGRYAEALTLLEEVLRVRAAALGSEHVDVANALTCIGGIHSCTGRHAEALERYEQATSIRKAVLGPDHVTVAMSLRNSGTALACLGQTSLAIEHCKEAHAILLRQLGPEHPISAKIKELLADLTTGNPRAQVRTQQRFSLHLFDVCEKFRVLTSQPQQAVAIADPTTTARPLHPAIESLLRRHDEAVARASAAARPAEARSPGAAQPPAQRRPSRPSVGHLSPGSRAGSSRWRAAVGVASDVTRALRMARPT